MPATQRDHGSPGRRFMREYNAVKVWQCSPGTIHEARYMPPATCNSHMQPATILVRKGGLEPPRPLGH